MSQSDFESSPDAPDGAGEGAALDMNRSEDRRLLAEALRRNWGVTPERTNNYLAGLDNVIRESDPSDPKGAQAIAQANRILVMLRSLMLKDLHKLEEYARLDAGKPTKNVHHTKGKADHDALRHRIINAHRPSSN